MSHIFKIGDRVRILDSDIGMTGKEGVIWKFDYSPVSFQRHLGQQYFVDIDGVGRENDHCWFAYPAWAIAPIQPPKFQIDEILAMKDLPDFECRKVAA